MSELDDLVTRKMRRVADLNANAAQGTTAGSVSRAEPTPAPVIVPPEVVAVVHPMATPLSTLVDKKMSSRKSESFNPYDQKCPVCGEAITGQDRSMNGEVFCDNGHRTPKSDLWR